MVTVACVVGAGVDGEDALEVVAAMADTSATGERLTRLRLHGAARAEKLELHEAT
jgi:hypothetical protein